MTDKEKAVKWVMDNCCACVQNEVPIFTFAEQAYLAGLNADRWHYPSKGELPDRDGEYLCRYYKYDLRFSKVLFYRVEDNKWYNLDYDEEHRAPKPDAWQYIEPPKEEIK